MEKRSVYNDLLTCNDNLKCIYFIELIYNEICEIKCQSTLKNILEIIRHKKLLSKL